MSRTAEVERTTKETSIKIRLGLDGSGKAALDYPVGFMAHMLDTFARHGLFDLEVSATGDLHVDQHHLIEDTGIVLGACFAKALGEKRGILRNGSCLFPMDETLACAAVDLSGRPFLFFEGRLSGAPLVGTPREPLNKSAVPSAFAPCGAQMRLSSTDLIPIGLNQCFPCSFQTDAVEDFWQGFAGAAGCNLHLEVIRGRSDHHKIEAMFKAAARSLRAACGIDERARNLVPSTKGTLDGAGLA